MASIRALTPEAKPRLWERSCPRTHKRQRILHIPPPQALEAQGCSQDIKSLDWARPEQREEPEHLASYSGPQGGGTSQGRPPGPHHTVRGKAAEGHPAASFDHLSDVEPGQGHIRGRPRCVAFRKWTPPALPLFSSY